MLRRSDPRLGVMKIEYRGMKEVELRLYTYPNVFNATMNLKPRTPKYSKGNENNKQERKLGISIVTDIHNLCGTPRSASVRAVTLI